MIVSNGTSTQKGELLCQIILKAIDLHKYRSSGPCKSGWMHESVHMDLHRSDIVTSRSMSCSQQAGYTEQEGHDGPVSLHWLILGNLFKT